jgi:hypothetical protein
MAEEIQCASCGVRFPPQNEHQGKMVVCPHCHRPTRNEPAGPPPPAANPYASPEAAISASVADAHQASPVDSPEIYRALAGTRPWTLFLGVLGFILSGIGLLWAIGFAIIAPTPGRQLGVEFSAVAFVVAVVAALVSWFSFRYGRRIGVFLRTQDLHDLERALSSQRAFWRLAGIAAALTLIAAIVASFLG